MKEIAVALVALASLAASARGQESDSDEAVTFSKYTAALEMASYDEKTHTHGFVGTLTLTGTVFLEFDMNDLGRANGEINFQRLVPDAAFVSQLPAVVKGFYPGPVRYLNLDASPDQLSRLFGGQAEYARISHGPAHEVSARARLVVTDYSTTVECDSRSYAAHVVSVIPVVEPQQLASREAPDGC